MNRIDRLTGTLLLLQSDRGLTAERIAEHWEVSVRTVYRDLAALAEAGVPVLFSPEEGYRLAGGYHMPPVQFTDREAASLFVAGEVTERIADPTLRESLRSALLKIRSVLPEDRREYVSRLKRSVDVWWTPSGRSASAGEFVPIQEAVLRRRCLRLHYDTGGEGTIRSRVVEPLGLVYYAANWHLIAYCRLREDFRDFRLDRVTGLEVLDETYEGHDGFSVDTFLAETMADWEPVPVTLVLERETVDRFLREHFGLLKERVKLPDGRVRVELDVYSLDWLTGWLLSFGTRLEVESPPELREKVVESARAVADRYDPNSPVEGRGTANRAKNAKKSRIRKKTPETDIGLSVRCD